MADDDRYKVLVSMPTYRTPSEMLHRAVQSVLAQRDVDFQLVVIADGEDVDLPIKDERLVIFRLPENRGAYFAQSVSLAANPYDWYSPHGSDDWTDPDHLINLWTIDDTAVAAGSVWWHNGDREPTIHEARYEVGMFDTDRLREIGGYNPNERMGQDSLMLKILANTGTMKLSTIPTYHRLRRPGSLTTDPRTKIGSPARNEMRRRNRAVYHRVVQATTFKQIRQIRRSVVPVRIQQEVLQHAERLRGYLG